jgi:hypothetical protein
MGGDVAGGGRSIRFIVHLPLGAMTAGLGAERERERERERESMEGKMFAKFDYYLEAARIGHGRRGGRPSHR